MAAPSLPGLAARVGPAGHVLVTDIDPRFLESLQALNLEVRRHDIATDPLPEAAFDLVHSRLVLLHLPEREKALARMVAALKPGGWLVDEEFDSSIDLVSSAYPEEVYSKTYVAMARTMDSRGVDRRFGRRLFGRLRAHGLVDVNAEGRTFMWHSGSSGVSLLRSNYEQLRSTMIDAGYITEADFNQDLAGLDDPGFMMPSPILWTAWGRRP
ncbi:methyltransferase domain-containing protein [Tunturiibacter empetritectus]|uniref:class I SAM-dependent methyltransferase n=1 Tax=Tunturiibacter empetritectus TaxID=3069691 RepID=UPI003D9B2920